MLVVVLLALASDVVDRRRNSETVPCRHGAAPLSADLNAWSAFAASATWVAHLAKSATLCTRDVGCRAVGSWPPPLPRSSPSVSNRLARCAALCSKADGSEHGAALLDTGVADAVRRSCFWLPTVSPVGHPRTEAQGRFSADHFALGHPMPPRSRLQRTTE